MPRIHCPLSLAPDAHLLLPEAAARHVQVLRMQPGQTLTLFSGDDDLQWPATITRMGRSDVAVQVGSSAQCLSREAPRPVHLLAAIITADRMDWLVEKATELGVASVTPILAERSVLRLRGERADRKHAHWQAVAAAACEQCGRNRIPTIKPMQTLAQCLTSQKWFPDSDAPDAHLPTSVHGSALRLLLSPAAHSQPLARHLTHHRHPTTDGVQVPTNPVPIWLLCGPEGGLTPQEEASALGMGFAPTSLGPRILRAETAPLATLAAIAALDDMQAMPQ